MPRAYAYKPADPAKATKARGSYLRVHFKNTVETAAAIRGMGLKQAQTYLNNVIKHKDIVPFRKFLTAGRKAMARKYKASGGQGRFPEKSCRFLLDLLQNAQSNAEVQNLDVDQLVISHIQVQQAPKLRRRTYRAHGRINPYMASPSHIELVLTQKSQEIRSGAGAAAPRNVTQGRLESGATAGAQ